MLVRSLFFFHTPTVYASRVNAAKEHRKPVLCCRVQCVHACVLSNSGEEGARERDRPPGWSKDDLGGKPLPPKGSVFLDLDPVDEHVG